MYRNLHALTTLVLFFFISGIAFGGTFTSNVASGNWHLASSWIAVGDADGIPDLDDDITILPGHNITCSNSTNLCNNLTVNGTVTLNLNKTLYIRGDYTVNGSETGTGKVRFYAGASTNISGTGSFGTDVIWYVSGAATPVILNGTTVNKNVPIYILGATITNQGNFTVNFVYPDPGSVFINDTGGILTIKKSGFMAGETFDASAVNNTVRMNVGGNLPVAVGDTYNNLTIMAAVNSVSLTRDITVEGNLLISNAGSLIQNGHDLTVSGNISLPSTGTIVQTGSVLLTLDGFTAAQTVAANTVTLRNLEIANPNGVTFTSGNVSLASTLILTDGNLTINGGATFTMLSTSTETARIDEVTGSSVISGNMVLQRYISSQAEGRDTTWADLASPVQASTFADWDNELLINYSNSDAGTAWTFSEPADDWVFVSGASQALLPGQGYEMFLTDDFTLSSWSGVTLTTVGTPNVGNQNLSARVSRTLGNSNYNLVGNPFQSSIAWTSVFAASTNIGNFFDYYDFTAGTYSTGGAGDEIGTGQGFWVFASGANPQFIVPESAKTASANSTIRHNRVMPYMTLTLTSADGSHTFSHKLRVGPVQGATANLEGLDHPLHLSPNKTAPAIYAKTADGYKVVVQSFDENAEEMIIPVGLKVGIAGDYKITVDQTEFISQYSCATFVDMTTGQKYDLYADNTIVLAGLETGTYEGRFEIRLSGGDCRNSLASEGMNNSPDIIQVNGQPQVNFHYSTEQNVRILIHNTLGQEIIPAINFTASRNTCSLGLPADYNGFYTVTVINGNEVMTKKLIKY